MEVLANRLKWLREKKRLGQKEVASNIGVTLSGYQQYEYLKSKPSLETLVRICDFYNVSADFLLGRENYTEELAQIEQLIEDKKSQLSYYHNKQQQIFAQISELRHEMLESAQEKGFVDARTVQLSERLDEKLYTYNETSDAINALQSENTQNVMSYIKQFLKIPQSNSKDDRIIEKYFPFKASIQMNIFDEYELVLFSNEGKTTLGTFEILKDETEAVKLQEEILKRLNSRN